MVAVYDRALGGPTTVEGFTTKEIRLLGQDFVVKDDNGSRVGNEVQIPKSTVIRFERGLMSRLVDSGLAVAPKLKPGRDLARQLTGKTVCREVTLTLRGNAIDTKKRTAVLSFSSEVEVERWYGIEVLSHSAGHVRLGRLNNGAPLLHGHNRNDQIGVVDSAQIAGRHGIASVRLSRSARGEEFLQDLLDGIRRKVSVGYRIHKVEVEKLSSDVEKVRVVDWEPQEISLVSIPADDSVGVIIGS